MKNKDVEDIVVKALEEYSSKQDEWDVNIETITKEAFTELKLKGIHEMAAKRIDNEIDRLNKDLWEHQKAIDYLRGYITFLESKISKLEHQLDEHEDSY
jgi:predicted  nucleic acid-binding Zn-ribbon protein